MGKEHKAFFSKNDVKLRIAQMRAAGIELPLYNLSVFIAVNALMTQTDLAGNAYSHHMIEVSRHNTDSESRMIIGMLHDVVEDSDWALDDLRDAGFPERIISGIDGVTHRDGEKYFDSIERCGLNRDSVDVKLKDNRHNLDTSRNNWLPGESDLERQKKYVLARLYLVGIKKKEVEPGTKITDWLKTQPAQLQDWDLVRRHSRHMPPAAGFSGPRLKP